MRLAPAPKVAVVEGDTPVAEEDKVVTEEDKAVAEVDKAVAEVDKVVEGVDTAVAEEDKVVAEEDESAADEFPKYCQTCKGIPFLSGGVLFQGLCRFNFVDDIVYGKNCALILRLRIDEKGFT
jgi:hypothetical protein